MKIRCVVVPADTLQPEIRLLGEPLYQTAGRDVDGWIEVVHPVRLAAPLCMIVNEEGLIRSLPENRVGSWLYGSDIHGWPICGNLVILKDGIVDGEPDIVGLTEEEAQVAADIVRRIAGEYEKAAPGCARSGSGRGTSETCSPAV